LLKGCPFEAISGDWLKDLSIHCKISGEAHEPLRSILKSFKKQGIRNFPWEAGYIQEEPVRGDGNSTNAVSDGNLSEL
jgi:hypothetical protein